MTLCQNALFQNSDDTTAHEMFYALPSLFIQDVLLYNSLCKASLLSDIKRSSWHDLCQNALLQNSDDTTAYNSGS